MNGQFKHNMKKHNMLRQQAERLNLEMYGGCVVDNKMFKHAGTIVCRTEDLVESDSDFLEANPLIAQHLEQRELKIKQYRKEQAEAHAWSNRPIKRWNIRA